MSDGTGIRVSPAAEAERVKRRRERWAIGVVAVLVAGLTLIEANLAAIGGRTVTFTSNIVIFALININVVLVVLLIFLVTRNVFKILLDRRRNILGAKIRSRLVLIFICFSLIPTILLFIAATNITTTSIKSWIGGRVGQALFGALEIARGRLEAEAFALKPVAEEAAANLPAGTDAAHRDAVLRDARAAAPPGSALILARDGKEVAREGDVPPAVAAEVLSRIPGGGATRPGTIIGEGFAAAWSPVEGGVAVVAVRALLPAEAARIHDIAMAYDEYHQVRLLDDPIRASYVGILILITLLIVFAASWMGIYLARQITVPVALLAEGTEQVARGDLDVALDYHSDDEFGTLVASFNRMTADLKTMKGSLEAANASLTQTYEELRRRTQFIVTILDNISTGVVVIDRHGRIAMINKVAERLLGIPTDRALGRMYREVVEEEHYEAVRGILRQAGESAGGQADRQVERQVELQVGKRKVTFRVSLTSLHDDAGEYMGMVAAFDDLSQAMRLQRVLAWREVARRIAHDIRNPLTPIQLSTERMQRRYAAEHAGDPAFAECTQAILSEVANLKHLVEEFTRFARMPAPRLSEGHLAEEIRPVVETYRTAHPKVLWEFQAEEMPPVWFDPFQIRRAVTNLLENAASALGGRGRVTVTLSYDPAREMVRIVVADDGPGVPPEDRNRLFEPYFSRREGGTGLGLAIVSAVANDHGGSARMRDNAPRGAVFELEFPMRPEGKR